MTVARLDIAQHLAALADLLIDAIDSGASIGFLAPLDRDNAEAYWQSLENQEDILIWGAWSDDNQLQGSIQLHLAGKANATHRAEIAKLMVHRRARRQGIGRALMQAAEVEAVKRERTTLVLDTRQGDPSEALYQSLGWQRAGAIPAYARSSGTNELHATAIYYKLYL